jgi:hypothetical protein
MLWDICIPVPVCQFNSYTPPQLVLGCVDMVHKPFACSSDHNYRTTSRQLQATELFKLLVVGCLRFLVSGQTKRQCRCTWLCVRLARTLCMWQQPEQLANSCNCTVRAAQHASNHLSSPGVYGVVSGLRILTVLTCCTNPVHATGALTMHAEGVTQNNVLA